MSLGVSPACVCLCEGVGSAGVRKSCELHCWGWELNRGPLGEQPVILTAESSLQLLASTFEIFVIKSSYSHIFPTDANDYNYWDQTLFKKSTSLKMRRHV